MQAFSHDEALLTDERRHVVQRIVASPNFSRSPRLVEFLTYVCDRALDGRADEICEQQIGVEVFKRPPNYNPNDDSIVRSHARLLRQKLGAYFEENGQGEKIRIHIPKGHYVPCFEPLEIPANGDQSKETRPATASKVRFRRQSWMWASSVVVLAVGSFAAYSAWFAPKPQVTTHIFWSSFFSSGKEVFIVPADSALALVEDITHRRVGLTDYLNHTYHFELATAPGWSASGLSNLASRQYTSMADLNLSARLVRLPEAAARPIHIRYARNLQTAELKEGSAILIGGPRANPWEDLFQDKMNFVVGSDPATFQNKVENKSPLAGEQKVYAEAKGDSSVRAYGVVALLPGLRAATRTLVVEGTSSTGTECAADFLLDETALGSFIAEISKRAGPSGTNNLPFFEVLLQSSAVAGSAPQPEIVAYRIIRN